MDGDPSLKEIRTAVFIQCVGSRREGEGCNPGCSRYCCPATVDQARALAERLEVSERTIYRDIADLVGSGVPVEGEAELMRPSAQVDPDGRRRALLFTIDGDCRARR